MGEQQLQIWDLWYPQAGATGLPFARGRLDPTGVLYVHAAPDTLSVEVRMSDGTLVARGQDLRRSLPDYTPITRLTCADGLVVREDVWPGDADLGKPVILPGGEVGILKAWWHAPDQSEWRWQAEFYNRR